MSEFLHVVENGQRDGKQVYVVVRTFTSWAWLMRYLLRDGAKPVWVIQSESERVVSLPKSADVWNSGGWQKTVPMFPFPLVDERKGRYSPEKVDERQYRAEDAKKGWVW